MSLFEASYRTLFIESEKEIALLKQERAELRRALEYLLARPNCKNCRTAVREVLKRIKEEL